LINLTRSLLEVVRLIAEEAGKEILKIYQLENFIIQSKSDNTPLTQADKASHNIILSALSKLAPETPILSEEGEKFKLDANTYWCVDPLDGTKEFIKRNGEFTVNIALIRNYVPVLGVIHIPVKNKSFVAMKGRGAEKICNNQHHSLPKQNKSINHPAVFAVSRSHLNQQTHDFIKQHQADTIAVGSSLKLCLLAEGKVDAYPRFGPTSSWDMAAGHAILKETGGEIYDLDYKILAYNSKKILNPNFIAVRHKDIRLKL
jgi:3'(2'), 5'-bisphosphate nucleotidase